MLLRTAKSCGPDAPTQVLRMASRPYRVRTSQISADDGGKRARSPGRARHKLLKPLRAGMPGDSGVLVVTRVLSANTKCTRGRGCNGHPAFPTPSVFGGTKFMHNPGASRRGIERAHVFGSLKFESDVGNSMSWTVSFILALKSSRFWVSMTSPQSRRGRS